MRHNSCRTPHRETELSHPLLQYEEYLEGTKKRKKGEPTQTTQIRNAYEHNNSVGGGGIWLMGVSTRQLRVVKQDGADRRRQEGREMSGRICCDDAGLSVFK